MIAQVGKVSKTNKRAGWNKAMQVGIFGILSLLLNSKICKEKP